MGTRNLTVVKTGGEMKVCQYGQWDGYLSCQGKKIFKFLKSKERIKKLVKILKDVKLLSPNTADATFDSYALDFDERSQRGDLTKEDDYYFVKLISRDVCGSILENLITVDRTKLPKEFGKTIYLRQYEEFEECKANGYCDIWIEYTYIIDLDKRTLEVWNDGKKIRDVDLNNMPKLKDFIGKND